MASSPTPTSVPAPCAGKGAPGAFLVAVPASDPRRRYGVAVKSPTSNGAAATNPVPGLEATGAPKTARTIVDSPRPVLAKLPNRKNMAKGFDGSLDRFAGMGLSRCANLRALDAGAAAVCRSLKTTREAMEKHLPEFDDEPSVLHAARSASATIFSMSCPGGDMHEASPPPSTPPTAPLRERVSRGTLHKDPAQVTAKCNTA